LFRHSWESQLLTEDPAITFDSGERSQQKGQWDDVDYPSDLWKKGRSLGRERSVLACLIAHLNAMKFATENSFDVIIEDNVRVSTNAAELAEHIRSVIKASPNVGARYFGFLGPSDNIEWFFDHHIKKYEEKDVIVVRRSRLAQLASRSNTRRRQPTRHIRIGSRLP